MFCKKLSVNLNSHAHRSLRIVRVASFFPDVHTHKRNESIKNSQYFSTASHRRVYSFYKKRESDWREKETINNGKYFYRILSVIPAFILISLFGAHSAICLEDTVREEKDKIKDLSNQKIPSNLKQRSRHLVTESKNYRNSENKNINNKLLNCSKEYNLPQENITSNLSECEENNIELIFDKIYNSHSREYYNTNYESSSVEIFNLDVNAESEKKLSSPQDHSITVLTPATSSLPKEPPSPSTSFSSSEDPTSDNKNNLKPLPNHRKYTIQDTLSLKNAIELSRLYVNRRLSEAGAPGIVIAVSVNGKLVWSEGIGLADVENSVRMSPYTVMRIASISKALTSTMIGKFIQEGKLDLDAPIQKYVPSFPEKKFNGEKVTITTRHLLTHTSGIRHYQLKEEVESENKEDNMDSKKDDSEEMKGESKNEKKENNGKEDEESKAKAWEVKVKEKRKKMREILADKALKVKKKKKPKSHEFDLEEYYIKEEFKNLEEALQLFRDDDLLIKPGTGYLYSSHAYTLVSAVLEKIAEKPFTRLLTDLFRDLGMIYTYLDKSEPIVYRRGRYYVRDDKGKLKNAPYVDNSYKWAGGGILSSVLDLLSFGNAMLYSYQNVDDKEPKGILKSSIVRQLWSPSPESEKSNHPYGLGWGVSKGVEEQTAFAYNKKFYASHSGGAVGASSVLLIMPTYDPYNEKHVDDGSKDLAQGVVVSIIINMQNVALTDLALRVADIFSRVPKDSKVVGSVSDILKNKVYSLEKS